MTPETLLAFNLAVLAAWAAPGPAFLLAVRTTLAQGRRAGLAAGAALALTAAFWTGLALAGLGSLFAVVPWAYVLLKIGGAAYLVWIAIGLWRGSDRPLPDHSGAGTRAFRTALLVNLSNPKSVLFAAAVLVVLFPADLGLAEKALIVANHLVLEGLLYGAAVMLLSRPAVSRAYLGLRRWLDKGAAAVMGALGIRLLLDR